MAEGIAVASGLRGVPPKEDEPHANGKLMTPSEPVTFRPDRSAITPASILVVDDEAAVCQVLSAMLKADGYIVETAQSGREAVDCLRNRHFDVTLTDLVMPEMDGIQTMAALKDLDADIEVIFVTGHSGVDSACAALKQGACDYLQKPISAQQLQSAVVRAIEVRRLNSSLSPYEAARALMKSSNRQDLTISQFIKRKRAEEELRLTQFSVENALDAVLWTDSSGRFLYVNEAACHLLNCSREELLSLSVPEVDVDVSRERWPSIWEALKLHGSHHLESRMHTKQGSVFPVEVTGKYLKFGDQEYSFSFVRDITERKVAEEALRASEQRYRRFVEENAAGFARSTKDGIILDANDTAVRMFGYRAAEELKGRQIGELYVDSADRLRMVTLLKQQKRLTGYELPFQQADGSLAWHLINMTMAEEDGEEVVETTAIDITKRKRAEEALQASESRYRQLFENNVAAIIRTTMDGRIMDCNVAAARILGYPSPQDMLGLSMRDFHSDPEKRMEMMARLQAGETVGSVELKFRHKNGRPIWLIFSLILTPPGDTGETFVQATFVDITERRHSEEELYRSRQMLQSILDNIPQRVFWKDRNSTYLGCNRAFATDAGLNNPEEILGKKDFDLTWSGTADLYCADDRLVMERGAAKLNFDESETRPDGSMLWRLTNKLPMRDREGNVTGVLGTYDDITERKQAEESLQASEEQFRQLAETIREVFFVSTPEPVRVTYVSPAYEEIWGRSREEIYERPDAWIESIYAEDRPRAIQVFGASQRGSATDHEYRIVRPDGAIRWVRNRTFPVNDGTGRFSRVVGIAEDITDRQQAEQALVRAEEKYRSLVLNLPDAVWTVDATGQFAFISPNVEKITGYSVSEIEQCGTRLFMEAIHPDDIGAVQAAIEGLFSRGEAYNVECRSVARMASGSGCTIGRLATYEKNGVRYADGILSDITDRKRAEEALRESTNAFGNRPWIICHLTSRYGRGGFDLSPSTRPGGILRRSRRVVQAKTLAASKSYDPEDVAPLQRIFVIGIRR